MTLNRSNPNRASSWRGILLACPGTVWIAFFAVAPLLLLILVSFLSNGEYGEVERSLTLEHYKRFAGFGSFGWEPLYLRIVGQSFIVAAAATGLCLLLALPTAIWLAALPVRWRTAGLVLITVPLWTNLLVRTYSWQMLLAQGGPISAIWTAIGGNADALYPGPVAVYVGLVCDYLPFLILPIYASVEKIDWLLVEAARDLGADPWRAARHAVWPQIKPGVWAGVVLVFVPATAQFIVSDLLGGSKAALLGNVIQQQFGPSQNWPFGSAIACIGMTAVFLGLLIYIRTSRDSEATS